MEVSRYLATTEVEYLASSTEMEWYLSHEILIYINQRENLRKITWILLPRFSTNHFPRVSGVYQYKNHQYKIKQQFFFHLVHTCNIQKSDIDIFKVCLINQLICQLIRKQLSRVSYHIQKFQ